MTRDLLDHLRLTAIRCESEAERLVNQAAQVAADFERRHPHGNLSMTETSDQDVYDAYMNRAIEMRSLARQATRHWTILARDARDLADEADTHPLKEDGA
jgi:hypothetical protein